MYAFKVFFFDKRCSVLIGSHRISFPYLLHYVHSSTTKGKRLCDEKFLKIERYPRELIGCKGWECALDKRPGKKYIWERHFSNHRNVWKVKMSWLDRVQDTPKKETTNHTQHQGVAFQSSAKMLRKNRFSLEKKIEMLSSSFLFPWN